MKSTCKVSLQYQSYSSESVQMGWFMVDKVGKGCVRMAGDMLREKGSQGMTGTAVIRMRLSTYMSEDLASRWTDDFALNDW